MPISPETYLAAWNLVTSSMADAKAQCNGDEDRAIAIMFERFDARGYDGSRRRAALKALVFSDVLDALRAPPVEAVAAQRSHIRSNKLVASPVDGISREEARDRLDSLAALEQYRAPRMPKPREPS